MCTAHFCFGALLNRIDRDYKKWQASISADKKKAEEAYKKRRDDEIKRQDDLTKQEAALKIQSKVFL